MKINSQCPKCASKEISIVHSSFGTYNNIKIGIFDTAMVSRFICIQCGFMEQYVENLEVLKNLERKM